MADRIMEGKVVLVTGASSGIGAATARTFAQAGGRLVLADIDESGGRAMEKALQESGAEARFVRADVTRGDEVEAMVAFAVDTFGGLDCAANVAGGMLGGDRPGLAIHETDEAAWDGTTSLCLRGVWLCLKYEVLHMMAHGGGTIVNVASVAGMLATRDSSAAYAVAKAGVIHLTRTAAASYAKHQIRVNAVAPGLTATANVRKNLSGEQLIPSGHMIKRMAEPEEQAQAMLWLCSDASAMTTGHVLPVDGGWTSR